MKNKTAKQMMSSQNFLISIYHQENHSWQGEVQWLDTGKKVRFRSELELLFLIQGAVTTQQSNTNSFRTWEDDQTLKSAQ